MINISKIPFFRVLLPYVLGVLLCMFIGITTLSVWYFVLLFSLGVGLYLLTSKNSSKKLIFLVAVDIALLALGVLNTQFKQSNRSSVALNYETKQDTIFFVVQLNEMPVPKLRTTKLELSISHVKDEGKYKPLSGKLLAYLQNSTISKQLKFGTSYLIKVKLQEVNEPLNPHAFNYKNYLANNGVYHTVYIDSNSICETDLVPPFSITSFGLNMKQRFVNTLKRSELSQEAYSILAALLTGYDDEIDKDVIDDFSRSGTLHVLSV